MPLSGSEIKSEFLDATSEFKLFETSYSERLIKYAYGLTVAEITLVGFLFQSSLAHELLHNSWSKALLISSFLSCVMTIGLNLLSHRFRMVSAKNMMHFWQYIALASPDLDVMVDGNNANGVIDNAESKSADHKLTSYEMSSISKKLRSIAELTFAISAGTALIFAVWLVSVA